MKISLENQLFDWDGWDSIDEQVTQYYDVILKVPVGEFPIGTKFETAVMCLGSSVLQLYNGDDLLYRFSLKLSIGNKL